MILSYYRQRGLLLAAVIVGFLCFAAAGDWLGIPADPGRGGSLLRQPGQIIDWVGLILALAASVAVGTALAGRWKFDLGLAAAAAGMVALAHRGGPMRYVLLYSTSTGVYLLLMVEVALLFALLGVAWFALLALRHKPGVGVFMADHTPEERLADARDPEEPLDQKLLGVAVAAATMGLLMVILCRTDDPTQCLAAVGLSACLGVLCGHQFVPSRPSVWWWTTPMLVAAVGYGFAFFSPAYLLSIGEAGGTFAPLARPLPLAYASAGVFGSILGYHLSRRIRRDKEEEEDEEIHESSQIGTNEKGVQRG